MENSKLKENVTQSTLVQKYNNIEHSGPNWFKGNTKGEKTKTASSDLYGKYAFGAIPQLKQTYTLLSIMDPDSLSDTMKSVKGAMDGYGKNDINGLFNAINEKMVADVTKRVDDEKLKGNERKATRDEIEKALASSAKEVRDFNKEAFFKLAMDTGFFADANVRNLDINTSNNYLFFDSDLTKARKKKTNEEDVKFREGAAEAFKEMAKKDLDYTTDSQGFKIKNTDLKTFEGYVEKYKAFINNPEANKENIKDTIEYLKKQAIMPDKPEPVGYWNRFKTFIRDAFSPFFVKKPESDTQKLSERLLASVAKSPEHNKVLNDSGIVLKYGIDYRTKGTRTLNKEEVLKRVNKVQDRIAKSNTNYDGLVNKEAKKMQYKLDGGFAGKYIPFMGKMDIRDPKNKEFVNNVTKESQEIQKKPQAEVLGSEQNSMNQSQLISRTQKVVEKSANQDLNLQKSKATQEQNNTMKNNNFKKQQVNKQQSLSRVNWLYKPIQVKSNHDGMKNQNENFNIPAANPNGPYNSISVQSNQKNTMEKSSEIGFYPFSENFSRRHNRNNSLSNSTISNQSAMSKKSEDNLPLYSERTSNISKMSSIESKISQLEATVFNMKKQMQVKDLTIRKLLLQSPLGTDSHSMNNSQQSQKFSESKPFGTDSTNNNDKQKNLQQSPISANKKQDPVDPKKQASQFLKDTGSIKNLSEVQSLRGSFVSQYDANKANSIKSGYSK